MKKILTTLLLTVGVALTVMGQSKVGAITGKVVSRQGRQPIEMATVSLGDQSVKTAADGSFTFENLPYGIVTIEIEALGHQPSSVNVKVDRPLKDLNYITLAVVVEAMTAVTVADLLLQQMSARMDLVKKVYEK